VIGTGSGLDVANAVYQHGLKVAVIEKGKMGGTCLNRGCVPSKLLIHSADIIETIRRAHLFLVDKKNRKILGCHIIGTDASTLIHEVIVAMKAGNSTVDNILKSVHIHPALSEVIARAADQIK
jgi:mycothione reductase